MMATKLTMMVMIENTMVLVSFISSPWHGWNVVKDPLTFYLSLRSRRAVSGLHAGQQPPTLALPMSRCARCAVNGP